MRAAADSGTKVPRAAWLTLIACSGAAALLQMDGTIITVALPSVGDDLGAEEYGLSWLLTAYFVSYGLALFPGGVLVDRVGSRNVGLVGLAIFALGALFGAVADSLALLTVSRMIQGVGAGLVSPATLAGAVSGFPPEKRGVALGIWGAGSGMANLIAPLIGGVLTVAIDWRACLWFFVPTSLIAGIAIARLVPNGVHADERPETSTLRQKVIAASSMTAALTFVIMIGSFFIAQQFLQTAEGYSAIGAAAALTVIALLVAVGAPLSGRLSDKHGERPVVTLGWLLCAGSLLVFGIPGFPLAGVLTVAMLIPFGLGLGLLFVPVSRAALNAVSMSKHGRVSSLLSTARLLGAAFGAVLGGSALSGGVTADNVHTALLVGAGLCLLIGIPVARKLPAGRDRRVVATQAP